MPDLIRKLLLLALSVQEKVLNKKHAKKMKTNFKNSTSKTVIESGYTFNMTTKTEENKAKIEKKYCNNPKKT